MFATVFSGDEIDAIRLFLVVYSLIAVPTIVAAFRISPSVDPLRAVHGTGGLRRSKRTVYGLASLFALDSLSSGFAVQSLVVYWFAVRWGTGTELPGPVFFTANLLNALSYQLALPLSRRIGLVNTMVFTHLPANVFLMLVPVASTLPLAIALLLARTFLSRMDTAPRQSYVAAVVDPSERTASAAVTNVAKSTVQAISPVLTGWAIGMAAFGLPFYVCGGLKIVYDLALLKGFRHRKPPEEQI